MATWHRIAIREPMHVQYAGVEDKVGSDPSLHWKRPNAAVLTIESSLRAKLVRNGVSAEDEGTYCSHPSSFRMCPAVCV